MAVRLDSSPTSPEEEEGVPGYQRDYKGARIRFSKDETKRCFVDVPELKFNRVEDIEHIRGMFDDLIIQTYLDDDFRRGESAGFGGVIGVRRGFIVIYDQYGQQIRGRNRADAQAKWDKLNKQRMAREGVDGRQERKAIRRDGWGVPDDGMRKEVGDEG